MDNQFEEVFARAKNEYTEIFHFIKENKSVFDDHYTDMECLEELYHRAEKNGVACQDELDQKLSFLTEYVRSK